jgi:hypothetical protein
MSAVNDLSLKGRPAGSRPRIGRLRGVFSVVGGPAAWLIQICGGDWLASEPCFSGVQRYAAPADGLAWTGTAVLVLMIVCALIALGAFWTSWRIYRGTAPQNTTAHQELTQGGSGRAHFMALWGMVFGGGFCVATLFTAVAFCALPRCAG